MAISFASADCKSNSPARVPRAQTLNLATVKYEKPKDRNGAKP